METFEVRDKRGKERFYLDDAYLNGYAKICGIYATGVYISLCRHADSDQKCWPSIKRIAEELNISQTQVRRAIKILEQHNIIKKERLGKKLNNRYWLLSKSEWSDRTLTDSPDRTLTTSPQDTHPLPDRTLHSKETHLSKHMKGLATETVAEEFDSDAYLEEMIKNKQPHVSLIGRYLKDRGYSFATVVDVRSEIGQWLKPAKILSTHKSEEIETATSYVKKNWPNEWNLRTIAKYINNPKIYE